MNFNYVKQPSATRSNKERTYINHKETHLSLIATDHADIYRSYIGGCDTECIDMILVIARFTTGHHHMIVHKTVGGCHLMFTSYIN